MPRPGERVLELACGPGGLGLAHTLASLPDKTAQAIRVRAREAISAYETPTGLDIPGGALLAAGRLA
jgi:hypothetical protein